MVLGGESAGGHLPLLAADPQGPDGFEEDTDHVGLSRDVLAVIGMAPARQRPIQWRCSWLATQP